MTLEHSSTRMPQHYARVLDKNIMEDMQGVAKSIFKSLFKFCSGLF